MDLGRYSR